MTQKHKKEADKAVKTLVENYKPEKMNEQNPFFFGIKNNQKILHVKPGL